MPRIYVAHHSYEYDDALLPVPLDSPLVLLADSAAIRDGADEDEISAVRDFLAGEGIDVEMFPDGDEFVEIHALDIEEKHLPSAKPDGIFFANDDYHRLGRALTEYIKMLDSEAITETDPDGIEWYKVEVEEVRELAARLNVDLEV